MILCCKKQPDIFENFLGFWFYIVNNNLKKWVYQEWFYVVRSNPIFLFKNFLGFDFKCFNNLKILPGKILRGSKTTWVCVLSESC